MHLERTHQFSGAEVLEIRRQHNSNGNHPAWWLLGSGRDPRQILLEVELGLPPVIGSRREARVHSSQKIDRTTEAIQSLYARRKRGAPP